MKAAYLVPCTVFASHVGTTSWPDTTVSAGITTLEATTENDAFETTKLTTTEQIVRTTTEPGLGKILKKLSCALSNYFILFRFFSPFFFLFFCL